MNTYLQYFIGLESFPQEAPFNSDLLTRLRKRITGDASQSE